ncbi:alkaline phosphatase PhoX [Endothiovibrio diazotrophicus]
MHSMTTFTKKPLALALALAFAGAACAGTEADTATKASIPGLGVQTPDNFQFTNLSVPATAEERSTVRTTPSAMVNGVEVPLEYQVLYRSGDELPLLGGTGTVTWGAWVDKDGNNFSMGDGSVRVSDQESGPDYTSLLTYQDGDTTEVFAITQLESTIGGAYVTKLQQSATGRLTAVATRPVDTSGVFGMYVNCAGMVTPWGTHLGSEEYEPPMVSFDPTATAYDTAPAWARQSSIAWFGDESWHDEHMLGIADYNGLSNAVGERSDTETGVGADTFGYYYGWVPEIAITGANGETTVTKHYAMGRFSHELSYVMPDSKTVYMSDDGANTGFFMFIADTAGNLDAGTLYAARWNQTSGRGMGEATISWINLGHSDSASIHAALVESSPTDEGITFGDLFLKETPNSDGTCPSSDYTPVNAYDPRLVCVKLQSGQFDTDGDGTGDTDIATLASRLETRLYAGYLGATTEFRKEEGISFDPADRRLYVSMSEISRGMMNGYSFEKGDNRYDIGGHNHVQLTDPNFCGGVYGLDVVDGTHMSGIVDTAGNTIASEYVVVNMYGMIAGRDTGNPNRKDTCDTGSVANPDNVSMDPNTGELLIGDDGVHDNNTVWSFDTQRNILTRVATMPEGAESTSVYWHLNVNGWPYISVVAQHPGDGAHTAVGYIGVAAQ